MISVFGGSLFPVIATIDPQTVTTEQLSDVIDMSKLDQAIGICLTGDLAAGDVTFLAYSCDSGGANAVSLKAATVLTAHATTNDLSQIVIAVKAGDLLPSGKQHIKFGLTVGSTGGPAAAVVLGVAPRYGVAADLDLASVKQIKQ